METPLGGTEVHDLWSESVGDTFRVFVGHCGPDPEAVLFVSDANGLFGLTVDTVRLMQIPALVPSILVVGIGYPDAETLIDTARIRTRDLTPTPSRHYEGSGRADEFISFVHTELRPWLVDRYPRAVKDVTYFGHSLGGLFGAYIMLTNTTIFDRYILSSPSLWWDDEVIFGIERDDVSSAAERADVFFGIGGLETDAGRRTEAINLPVGHSAKPPDTPLDMVEDMRRFVAQLSLSNRTGLSVQSVELADEFHSTVPSVVLSRGLRHFDIPTRD